MDVFTLVATLIISYLSFMLLILGILFRSKRIHQKLIQNERQAILDAITNFRPLAASPDVRDTKKGIIDAITKRSTR